jgi:hypothetical protein
MNSWHIAQDGPTRVKTLTEEWYSLAEATRLLVWVDRRLRIVSFGFALVVVSIARSERARQKASDG